MCRAFSDTEPMPKKQVKKYCMLEDFGVAPGISLKAASIFELSHPARQTIMDLVIASPKKHTDFVKSLKIAPAEVSRHLQRLASSGFIYKNSKSMHEATQYGKKLCQELRNLDYICRNKDFFENHDLSAIPKELMSWSTLANAEIIKGSMKVLDALYQATNRAEMFIWSVTQMALDPFVLLHVHQLEKGLELRLIFKKNARMPSEYSDNRLLSLEIRALEDIPMCIIVNDKEALIILPDVQGEPDYSFALRSTEEAFLRWGSLMFEHCWSRGENVAL